MTNLLLQSCSASKQEVDQPIEAYDLYTGYFYKILKKAEHEGVFRTDLNILILSGEHGLLDPEEKISTYDQRMTSERAREMNSAVVSEIENRVELRQFDQIILNMGKEYQKAVTGLADSVEIPVGKLQGSGLGEKGHALYRFVRGDDAVVEFPFVA